MALAIVSLFALTLFPIFSGVAGKLLGVAIILLITSIHYLKRKRRRSFPGHYHGYQDHSFPDRHCAWKIM